MFTITEFAFIFGPTNEPSEDQNQAIDWTVSVEKKLL